MQFSIIIPARNEEKLLSNCRKFDKLGDWYFIKNYKESLALLKGKDNKAADKIWYDFER